MLTCPKLIGLLTLLAPSSALLAEQEPVASSITMIPAAISLDDGVSPSPQAAADVGRSGSSVGRYLDADTSWWTFGGGGSVGNNDVRDVNATVAYTYFIDDRVELTFEFALRGFFLDDDDAVGFNPNMIFRYHFWASEDRDWTAFADIGIGVMGTTSDVPEGGTSFNFTPRLGVGVTRRIDDDWRLQVGVRWSHISNGRIYGNDDNPASDGVAIGIGLITSF
jgi:hypothetical protein